MHSPCVLIRVLKIKHANQDHDTVSAKYESAAWATHPFISQGIVNERVWSTWITRQMKDQLRPLVSKQLVFDDSRF